MGIRFSSTAIARLGIIETTLRASAYSGLPRKRKCESVEMGSLQDSIRVSRHIFLEHIWPLWAADLAASQIISTEDSERPLEREADFSGTDAFVVRAKTGVLVPLASRVEYYDPVSNNPFNERYWDHYPRFTIRLAKARPDGSLITNVECQKRLTALDDAVSRRYLPLFTFQSLVRQQGQSYEVLQSSRVSTEGLFEYVRAHELANLSKGSPSRTRVERDIYRIITVKTLKNAGVEVAAKDCRTPLSLPQPA